MEFFSSFAHFAFGHGDLLHALIRHDLFMSGYPYRLQAVVISRPQGMHRNKKSHRSAMAFYVMCCVDEGSRQSCSLMTPVPMYRPPL